MKSNQIQIYQTYPTSQEKLSSFLTKTEIKILEYLQSMSQYCKFIHSTVKTISEKVGCCEKTVSRTTDKLNRLGIIRKYRYRNGVYEKCKYKLLQAYKFVKKTGDKFLDAGPKLAVRILRSTPRFKKNVPVVNYINLYNLNNNTKESYNVENSEEVSRRIKKNSLKGGDVVYSKTMGKPMEGQYISTMDKLNKEKQSWVKEKPEIMENPIAKIKDWIKWADSPEGIIFIKQFGYQVSPDLKWAIEGGGLSDEIKERFFKKYPLLRKFFTQKEMNGETSECG